MQRYLWQQADGRRHAYDTDAERPAVGQPLTTLCGATVTPRTQDMAPGMWFDQTCWRCDREWRVREGFPPEEIPALAAETEGAQ
ncbi:zinc finger protein [Saccharomonospora azurea]|uniref:zinc finger protein n=1 Tax=Saccharomonospora sp. NB11 TaxID=1642298 RepID=UPI0018D09EBC|nr:zinc finger protein [Saccharomonospora sp. NB11]